jgi:hypothetical protein
MKPSRQGVSITGIPVAGHLPIMPRFRYVPFLILFILMVILIPPAAGLNMHYELDQKYYEIGGNGSLLLVLDAQEDFSDTAILRIDLAGGAIEPSSVACPGAGFTIPRGRISRVAVPTVRTDAAPGNYQYLFTVAIAHMPPATFSDGYVRASFRNCHHSCRVCRTGVSQDTAGEGFSGRRCRKTR